MKQEEKDLLLKDLCARLPFSVKLLVPSWDEREMEYVDRVDVLYSVNGEVYQILEVEDIDSCYYVQVDKQNDNTYSFYATYYDGGTCLQECLENELEKMI